MGSIFRSEEMTLCQLFLSSEAAFNCVSELGEIGRMQFRDLNPDVNSFQRKYVHEVRRCDEMERKLRYLEKQIKKDGTDILDNGENPEAPQPKEMVDLEATFEKLENELKEVNANAETLQKNFLELAELKNVLQTTQAFFDEDPDSLSTSLSQRDMDSSSSLTQNLIPAEEGRGPVQLGFIAGVIQSEKMNMFERMLWRVCRGNVFVRQSEISEPLEDPVTGTKLRKTVFIIFFQGDQLKTKVKKICDGCKATMYPCPDSSAERQTMISGVKGRINDLSTVLSQTTDHRHRVLVAAAKHLRNWFIKVRKIKAIYHTLNMFNMDASNKCLIAEGWLPVADMKRIKQALQKGTDRSGTSIQPILNTVPTKTQPPTFFRTNKFTKAYQMLIEAYGIPTYREVNPGLYTCVTFPFLFAVMFGDAGHALIMLAFGLFMVLKEKALLAQKSTNEIWNMMFGGRYIILLMSLFSLYTGVIYNDVFSKSMNIFGTPWHIGEKATDSVLIYHEHEYMLQPGYKPDYDDVPYPFGFDPIWQISLNKIAFQNSYKMKISVIIGVCHMIFGVMLSILNHRFFRRTMNIFCEFIPQIIFLIFLFGWLCILVFTKWIFYGEGDAFDKEHGSFCAPSVLITFINMVLLKKDKPRFPCSTVWMFEGQYTMQLILLMIGILCIPIMLVPKPFLLKSQYKAKVRAIEAAKAARQRRREELEAKQKEELEAQEEGSSQVNQGFEGDGGEATKKESEIEIPIEEEEIEELEEFEFSEIFIHQAIHTIEYVLGSVSHTASYLRLWALSLAHAQLSEVLWNMVLRIGIAQTSTITGSIMLYLLFTAWAALTVSILVLMEGLSAFLHTLRLHWVEFCSKFYDAQGYKFQPFSFKHAIKMDEEET